METFYDHSYVLSIGIVVPRIRLQSQYITTLHSYVHISIWLITIISTRSVDESTQTPEGDSTQRKRKYHRSTGERIQCFLDDLRCGQILPSQVFCLLCEKWVQLSQTVPYVDSNWRRHADRCSTKYSLEATPEGREESLRQDSRIEFVENNSVLCKQCKKWIKLDGRRRYSHYNWNKHKNACKRCVSTEKTFYFIHTMFIPLQVIPRSKWKK